MSKRRTSYLADERSPYLKRNAERTVHWYPWGEKAFQRARDEDKPIFLSIGFSASYWCRLMDENTFGNKTVAELLNKYFVCIKVDRQERPDIAEVYEIYLGHAVYVKDDMPLADMPLSVFVSHESTPLMGGCYFRPETFEHILRKVKADWDEERRFIGCGKYAFDRCIKALHSYCKSQVHFPEKVLYQCAKKFASRYNEAFGGLGPDLKFPRPAEIQLMLHHSKALREDGKPGEADEVLEMVLFTLQRMAMWGIHDHVGGGFHRIGHRFRDKIGDGFQRYKVVQCSPVPQFQKMLYDQGQLAIVYLEAFSFTSDPFYSCVSRDILDFLRREMKGPEGEFFSAVGADSAESEGGEKKEGAFYEWTTSEVEHILGMDATLFKDHYNFREMSDASDDDDDEDEDDDDDDDDDEDDEPTERKYSPAMQPRRRGRMCHRTLEKCREVLFRARSLRPLPDLDETVIVSWNGLVISSLARASKILKGEAEDTKFEFPVSGCDPEKYMEDAEKAACFIKKRLYSKETGKLSHSFWKVPSKVPGFLADYAFLISGLLDLYEFGGRTKWLKWAIKLQGMQDKLFFDKEGGGYYNTTGDDTKVILRVKEDRDRAVPSGNSVSMMNLVRLSTVVDFDSSDNYRGKAKRLLATFGTRLKERPEEMPLMCCAAEMLSAPSRRVVFLGGHRLHSHVEFKKMLAATHSSYDPNTRVICIDFADPKDLAFWARKNACILHHLLGGATAMRSDELTAHVFHYGTKSKRHVFITDPSSLEAQLFPSIKKRKDQDQVGERVHWKPVTPPLPEAATELICGPLSLCVISFYTSAVDKYKSELDQISQTTGAKLKIAEGGRSIEIRGKPLQIQLGGDKVWKLVKRIPSELRVEEGFAKAPRPVRQSTSSSGERFYTSC